MIDHLAKMTRMLRRLWAVDRHVKRAVGVEQLEMNRRKQLWYGQALECREAIGSVHPLTQAIDDLIGLRTCLPRSKQRELSIKGQLKWVSAQT